MVFLGIRVRWLVALFLALPAVSLPSAGMAQAPAPIDITSTPNIVGSGARALGFGAFVAIADDATAASWNPGGLIQLERPEVSMVGAAVFRTEDNDFANIPGASGPQRTHVVDLNYLSAAYPFQWLGRNMVASLNYQKLLDFTKVWDADFSMPGALDLRRDIDYEQTGSLKAVSPAYAVQLTQDLSFGFALNFWTDALYFNGWESEYVERGRGLLGALPFRFRTKVFERHAFEGFNANVGVLWHASARFTVGAVFKTPFTARLERERTSTQAIVFPTAPGSNQRSVGRLQEDLDLDMPMSYGAGLAFRVSDNLSFALDVLRTHWQDFVQIDARGVETSAITGLEPGAPEVDPTTTIRLGGEYLFILEKMVIPVRAGVFYDPAPAPGSPDDFYGFSAGSGVGIGRFIFDVAYQYRMGRDTHPAAFKGAAVATDVDQHTIYSSLIVHF